MSYEIVYKDTPEDLDIASREREIVHLLREHDCQVTFIKKDGTERVMPCTLRSEVLPESKNVMETRQHKSETITVWCLDRGEWRAFKTANVRKISILQDS